MDHVMQDNQYGYMKNKKTEHAINYISRFVQKGERKTRPIAMVTLYWEKAFDKVKHDKLHEALERIGVDNKYCRTIKSTTRITFSLWKWMETNQRNVNKTKELEKDVRYYHIYS